MYHKIMYWTYSVAVGINVGVIVPLMALTGDWVLAGGGFLCAFLCYIGMEHHGEMKEA